MEDIVGLLHRRSDALTVSFAAVDLANLPPVSSDSLDVCALLARVDSTKAEMDLMKPRSSYLLTWRDDAPPVSVSRSEATGID